jgi:hypothetical protein
MKKAKQKPMWLSPLPKKCDICGALIRDHFVDGATEPDGIWGCMCRVCFVNHGKGLGAGLGQLYKLEAETGIWLLIDGWDEDGWTTEE